MVLSGLNPPEAKGFPFFIGSKNQIDVDRDSDRVCRSQLKLAFGRYKADPSFR